jgi:ABC-type transporter MlaC component
MMNRNSLLLLTLAAVFLLCYSCDSKPDPVTQGREAVKEVVTQPFNTLEGAKDSLKQSEEKSKAALEEADKESK